MKIDAQVEKVYAELGCALAEAQLLENYLGHLVLALGLSTDFASSKREGAVMSRRGLYQLIQNLEEGLPVPARFQARLEEAKIKRNWLAHSYLSDRADAFQTSVGRTEMVHELDQFGHEFYQLWGYLDQAIVAWLGGNDRTNTALIEAFTHAVCEA